MNPEPGALDSAQGIDANDQEVVLHKVHVGRHLLLLATDPLVQSCGGKRTTPTSSAMTGTYGTLTSNSLSIYFI